MPSPKTQPARGMRDFLPADVRKREYVIGVIKQVYERYGFEPLETPAVENIETLMGKYGEEGNQLIFKILKRGEHEKTGEADLALRYDLTVPLARVVAQYQNDLPKFFKRYQIQPVWRADRPARGRFREFYQCDVDVLGSQSMVVEAELIAAASDALAALGFKDFTIRLNHRQVLTGILDQAGVLREKHDDALIALDKMDKAGPEGVARELRERGIVDESAVKLMRFFEGLAGAKHALDLVDLGEAADARAAYNADVLGRLVEFIGAHEIGASGVDDLRQILQFAKASGTDSRIKLDPTLARGLAYYTGAIIEMNVADLAGSLGGGGRYDNLVGMFLGKEVPACGFSLGLERIIVVMTEREMFESDLVKRELVKAPADVLVTVWDEDSMDESAELAAKLRNRGLRVDLYPQPDKLQKQIKFAADRGIPQVAIFGPDERAKGRFALKDLRVGRQRDLTSGQAFLLARRTLTPFELDRVLQADQDNVNATFELLSAYGILDFYKRLPDLYDLLRKQIEQTTHSFVRQSADGTAVPAWDVLLRLYMAESVWEQFLIAGGHLFRGHISQIFGHMRRAMESAGIAYLSTKEADLGELFLAGDEKIRNRTSSGKILPKDDPLTADLNRSYQMASGQLHSNFSSFANKMTHDFQAQGEKIHYSYKFSVHEVNQETLGYFVNMSLWILRVTERSTRLIAESFQLPVGEWHEQHGQFKSDLDQMYQRLRGTILEDEPVSQPGYDTLFIDL